VDIVEVITSKVFFTADKVLSIAAGVWVSHVSSTNKADRYDKTEILLK
jgi:hypothetical protein